ncbi:23S rRNA (adenine(2503)-C(2))-methyltransferase RlmN [Candidatus Peregrinibacteria bacterium]|nr:23S rRNA (adenine(2503)-C(2))-methyltransferase RlmN [Candidatus Peregrinibacteria bacterium]
MNVEKLDDILKDFPAYRKKQVLAYMFKNFVSDFDEMTSLPKDLREILKKNCSLEINSDMYISDDLETYKSLITLSDGKKIEAVLMKHDDKRNTVCVSSQVGCPVGCEFCATGRMGFTRNLTVDEILLQVVLFERLLKKENSRVTNVVFMGMGEPMFNYENVMSAVRLLNSKGFFGIAARHISISTSGIVGGIKRLMEEKLQINLAISFHAPTDEKRSKIMPINKNFGISAIVSALKEYILKTKRRVMIEYILIDHINDFEADAYKLADIVKGDYFFVNLIPYNPTGEFKPSFSERVKKFKEILKGRGITVTQRYRFGRGIKAACGQLAVK